MKRLNVICIFLVAVSLACSVPVRVPTVPSAAPTRTAAPTQTAEATGTAEADTARVRAAAVVVRQVPDGEPTGKYILAGQEVTVLRISGDWVQIDEPRGWVFIGCLEGLSKKRCEAK